MTTDDYARRDRIRAMLSDRTNRLKRRAFVRDALGGLAIGLCLAIPFSLYFLFG